MPFFICPNCKDRSVDHDGRQGILRQAVACERCGFGFLFELLDDYYPAPNTGLVACDRNGRILAAGRGVFELTGYRDADLMGKDVVEAFGLDGFEDGKSPVAVALEWGVRQLGEKLELRSRAGQVKPVTADIFPGTTRRRLARGPFAQVAMHEKRIDLRWRDLDAYGHVNQAVYLTFAEEVLDHWFQEKLGMRPGTVWDYVAARTTIEYRSELRLTDVQVVGSASLARLGTKSVTANVRLGAPDGRVVAELELVVAAIDGKGGRQPPAHRAGTRGAGSAVVAGASPTGLRLARPVRRGRTGRLQSLDPTHR